MQKNKKHGELIGGLLLALTLPALADEGLPLGDGRVSSQPRAGYVYACNEEFHGGGAFRPGPWLRNGYWYPAEKIHVQGAVGWDNALITINAENGERVIRSNGLPLHLSGIFPIQPSDPAYAYDRNPNSILEQHILLRVPLEPQQAAQASCVNMGMIGVTTSGVALYNALDGQGHDAPAHEIQDRCNGHPGPNGEYHYHNLSGCLKDENGHHGRHSDLLGYALDGFGIYGPHGEGDKELRSADLDACHGHSHLINWDGKPRVLYHYHMTADYPYTLGCFRGTPVAMPHPDERRRPGMRRPPMDNGDGPPPRPRDGHFPPPPPDDRGPPPWGMPPR